MQLRTWNMFDRKWSVASEASQPFRSDTRGASAFADASRALCVRSTLTISPTHLDGAGQSDNGRSRCSFSNGAISRNRYRRPTDQTWMETFGQSTWFRSADPDLARGLQHRREDCNDKGNQLEHHGMTATLVNVRSKKVPTLYETDESKYVGPHRWQIQAWARGVRRLMRQRAYTRWVEAACDDIQIIGADHLKGLDGPAVSLPTTRAISIPSSPMPRCRNPFVARSILAPLRIAGSSAAGKSSR